MEIIMKKVQVKVLETNKKSYKVEYKGQSLWIRTRSLGKGNMITMTALNSGLAFVKEIKQERVESNKSVKFTKISETERAVKGEAWLTCTATDQQKKRVFFVPKSILENGEMPAWFANKKRKQLNDNENYGGSLNVDFQ